MYMSKMARMLYILVRLQIYIYLSYFWSLQTSRHYRAAVIRLGLLASTIMHIISDESIHNKALPVQTRSMLGTFFTYETIAINNNKNTTQNDALI